MKKILSGLVFLALLGAGCQTTAVAPAPTAPAAETAPTGAAPAAAPTPTTAPVVRPKTTTKAPAPAPAKASVSIIDFAFEPQVIAVTVGDTVVWKNNGQANHTVSSLDTGRLWDSGNIAPGQTFSRVFNAVGTYTYRCNIHSSMKGTVVVRAKQP